MCWGGRTKLKGWAVADSVYMCVVDVCSVVVGRMVFIVPVSVLEVSSCWYCSKVLMMSKCLCRLGSMWCTLLAVGVLVLGVVLR